MLQLNRNAEVSLHGQAADIEWKLERTLESVWELTVISTFPGEMETWKGSFDSAEAAMLIALFIDGEDCLAPEICRSFYDRLETKLKDCPQSCRIIP